MLRATAPRMLRWVGTALALGLLALLPAQAANLEGVLSPGDLIQGHSKAESDCDNCHVPFKKTGQDELCIKCHKDVGKDIAEHKGFHGRIKDRDLCRTCHTDHKGRTAQVVVLDEKKFNHDQTDFALKDSHTKVECAKCHLPKAKHRDALKTCYACHKKDDEDPKKKAHHGKFGEKCESCHTDKKWTTLKFDHDRDTKYPLRWKHADPKVKCKDCHTTEYVYRDKLKSDCIACHKKDDKHKGSEGDKCEKCHSERDWKQTHDFDHDKTKFPLRDAHADPKVKCDACHKTKVYTDAPKTCYGCHQKDDDDPAKKAHHGRYGQKCDTCHTVKDWKTLKFDHDRDTKYPLLGKHRTTKCDDCHTRDLYKDKAPTACIGCHRKDDKHKGKEGDRCEDCHVEQNWKTTKNKFDHDLTPFPLLGKHAKVDCAKCHKTLEFRDAKVACFACHEKEDQHKGRLGSVCEDCHNAVSWKRWDFNHDTRTRFKLDGRHAKIDCYACHRLPVQGRALLPMSCIACHQNDDAHGGSFGRQCEQCHITREWGTVKSRLGRGDTSRRDDGPMLLASFLAPEAPALWTAMRLPTGAAAAQD